MQFCLKFREHSRVRLKYLFTPLGRPGASRARFGIRICVAGTYIVGVSVITYIE